MSAPDSGLEAVQDKVITDAVVTCDWWLDDTQQCGRQVRALFIDWIKDQQYRRCARHDTRARRRVMAEAGLSRYDATKPERREATAAA